MGWSNRFSWAKMKEEPEKIQSIDEHKENESSWVEIDVEVLQV